MEMKSTSLQLPGLRRSPRAAFTLIELLVVIGMIVLLVGGIGVALHGGNKSNALQSAQGSLSSALSLVRAQAALTGNVAALAVNADEKDSDRYLRYYAVVTYDSTKKEWNATGEGEYLPAGVYFVPENTPSGSALLDSSVTFGGLKSGGFDGRKTIQINSSKNADWLLLGISALGQRVNALASDASNAGPNDDGRIMLATGEVQPPDANPPFKYNNVFNVRGAFISRYGVGASINNRDEYDAYAKTK